MPTFALELQRAWRSLLRRKAYFAACSATLALVLGANAAIFAVVNATLLRPLPFRSRGEVVHLYSQPPGTTGVMPRNPLQQMEVPILRERARSLVHLEGYYAVERVITLAGEPTVARAATVTPGLLSMLAAPIAQGRAFLDSEAQPGSHVAVVTDAYWRGALGGAAVLGSSLSIEGQAHTVVGILAPSFDVPFLDAQVLTPLHADPQPQARSPARTVQAVAELAAGSSLAQAREELQSISGRLAREYPATHTGWVLGVEPVREWQYGAMRAPLLMLFGATGLVLLIACVNIANLTSAQAVARAGELALRVALGATRADILRIHLAELSIVCAAGLVPGLLLAWAAVPALLAVNPAVARTLGAVGIDWRVQLFTTAAAMLTAVAASAIPASRVMHGQVSAAIAASASRTTASPAAVRLQRALVSIEVALCLALLMAGAVVIQGLRDLDRRSPGYQAQGVLTAQIRLPEATYKKLEDRVAVVERLLQGIRALPGVVSASTTLNQFIPAFSIQTLVTVKERPSADGQPHTVQLRRISTDYFSTLRIPVLKGRSFADTDAADKQPVAIVSRLFADRLLGGADPIGQVVIRSVTNPVPVPMTVVGVVDDVSDVRTTEAPEPTLYLPFMQSNNPNTPIAFVIRTSVDPVSLVPAVRQVARSVDATLPLRRVQPLETFVSESTAPERFRTMVLGLVALLGLVLAAVGISGVTYRAIVDRRREFAVRLALGSQPGRVVQLVMAESARDLALGAIAGLLAGALGCMVLSRSMQHVGAVDGLSTATAAVLLAVVGLAAAGLPALRVLRVQPAEVLRS
jgi:putative ABC transport system permease protein